MKDSARADRKPGTPPSAFANRLQLLDHDIRSAVSDVLGGLDLLDTAALPQASVLQLERVRASADALGRLFDEFLAEATGEPIFTFALDQDRFVLLMDVLRSLERRWGGHAKARGMTLDVHMSADLPSLVTLDASALERTLANLLSNALKFSNEGTITLRAELVNGMDLRFVVEDCGPGFSAEALSRLFEFGGRPLNSHKPGTGMGLHICKELADRLGGQLLVSNRQGRGARVTLTLPRDIWYAEQTPIAEAEAPNLKGIRVLLAEDNRTNQLVFQQMLQGLEAEAVCVPNGELALAELGTRSYDVALIDINMPVINGLEVIQGVRAMQGAMGQIPILAVTAFVQNERRDEIYRAGADGVLAKPIFDPEVFASAISSVLRRTPEQTVPQSSATPRPVGLDQSKFRGLLTTAGPEAGAELILRLKNDIHRTSTGLREGVRDRDRERVRADTHVLISLAGVAGSDGLLRVIQQLNTAASEGDPETWAPLAATADAELVAILADLAQLEIAHGKEVS